MNSVDELKPCPFCGGEAKLVEVSMDYDDVPPITILNEYTVECCECGASLKIFNDEIVRDIEGLHINHDGVKEAIEAWNRRTK